MKFEKTFLKSKVAQRIAFLFVLCALLPIATLAILSFNQVTKHLREQSLTRLRQTSKATAMGIYERLLFLEADMIRITSDIQEMIQFSSTILTRPEPEEEYQKNRFRGVVFCSETKDPVPIFGTISCLPILTPEEKRLVLEGSTLLTTHIQENHAPQIFLSRTVSQYSDNRYIVRAEVEPLYLWYMGYETSLPAMTEFFVLDHNKNVLFSTLQSSPKPLEQISAQLLGSSSGQFDWIHDGEDYLACYKDLFLQSKFLSPHWTVIASESKTYIHSPVGNFKKIFFLIILLSLWIVIFLSFNQIRRSLIPLEKLKAGAQCIAKRDFSAKVVITSRDEFADVAKTFNMMAYQLGRQFKTLTTIAEIDRAILSAFNTEDIVTTLLNRINDVFPSDAVGITLIDKNNPNQGTIYIGSGNSAKQQNREPLVLSGKDISELSVHREKMSLNQETFSQSYLVPLIKSGIKSFNVFPIFLHNTLAGIISFGFKTKPNYSEEDLSQARQLADQVGVALSNARLIEELSNFNWGTLRALARAIDAKSPWTAGHSERVTKFGSEIGKEMGLSEEEMDILQRGGLLHDIGKLGIPNKILDKPGKLTSKDIQILRRHPHLGARILEPISAYTDIMLIVLQHHENFDGTGYPDGLAGEEISLYSRIFAVADRYEALTASRPYRKAINPREAVKIVRENSGTQFDPTVVDAFFRVLKKKFNMAIPEIDVSTSKISARSLE